jgi:hypothetical protein
MNFFIAYLKYLKKKRREKKSRRFLKFLLAFKNYFFFSALIRAERRDSLRAAAFLCTRFLLALR